MNKENFIVKDSKWEKSDVELLFGNEKGSEEVNFTESKTLEDLSVEIGAYKSKSQARQAGRKGIIPTGWTELWINKKRKIWVWNPDKYIIDYA